jgi:hypothetical protein
MAKTKLYIKYESFKTRDDAEKELRRILSFDEGKKGREPPRMVKDVRRWTIFLPSARIRMEDMMRFVPLYELI